MAEGNTNTETAFKPNPIPTEAAMPNVPEIIIAVPEKPSAEFYPLLGGKEFTAITTTMGFSGQESIPASETAANEINNSQTSERGFMTRASEWFKKHKKGTLAAGIFIASTELAGCEHLVDAGVKMAESEIDYRYKTEQIENSQQADEAKSSADTNAKIQTATAERDAAIEQAKNEFPDKESQGYKDAVSKANEKFSESIIKSTSKSNKEYIKDNRKANKDQIRAEEKRSKGYSRALSRAIKGVVREATR